MMGSGILIKARQEKKSILLYQLVKMKLRAFFQEKEFYTRLHAPIPHHKMELLKERIGIFWR